MRIVGQDNNGVTHYYVEDANVISNVTVRDNESAVYSLYGTDDLSKVVEFIDDTSTILTKNMIRDAIFEIYGDITLGEGYDCETCGFTPFEAYVSLNYSDPSKIELTITSGCFGGKTVEGDLDKIRQVILDEVEDSCRYHAIEVLQNIQEIVDTISVFLENVSD